MGDIFQKLAGSGPNPETEGVHGNKFTTETTDIIINRNLMSKFRKTKNDLYQQTGNSILYDMIYHKTLFLNLPELRFGKKKNFLRGKGLQM
jgi:hypothetical protein